MREDNRVQRVNDFATGKLRSVADIRFTVLSQKFDSHDNLPPIPPNLRLHFKSNNILVDLTFLYI